MERPNHRYSVSTFYEHVTACPELGGFRTFTDLQQWSIDDQNREIRRVEEECNDRIAKLYASPSGVAKLRVTDLQHVHVREDRELTNMMEDLQKRTRRYGRCSDSRFTSNQQRTFEVVLTEIAKTLCLLKQVVELPRRHKLFTKHVAEYGDYLFENGYYVPTGEEENLYKQDPPHPDIRGIRALPQQDVLTEFVINNIKSLKKGVMRLAFWKSKQKRDRLTQESMDLDTIRGMVNFLTGIYASLLFTISLVVVSCVSSTTYQIAAAGLLGAVLAISLQLLVQNMRRAELFAIIAAFYAVVGMFIGAARGGSGGG